MADSKSYRSLVVTNQYVAWLGGQLLRMHYSIRVERPANLIERESEDCLILAPTHQTIMDPFLLAAALGYDYWRALVPVRPLATQTFHSPLNWFKPLIEVLYRLTGVVELPPKDEDGTISEKLQGLLDALEGGDVVAIFPEGEIWKKRRPPVGTFAPGIVYLHRASGAPIVPIAVWMSERLWPRRRYSVHFGRPVRIPEHLDLEAGAEWLRTHTLKLYEQAKQEEM